MQNKTKACTVIDTVPLPKQGPLPTLDPFLFCVHHNDNYPSGTDQLGPNASLGGRTLGSDFGNKDGWNMYHGLKVPGFPRHPHRGFETITAVKTGIIDHADSLGAAARYGDGDVQWLTAGNGINHAEMFPLLDRQGHNNLDFFQIWLNLPRAKKRVTPHFKMFWANQVPERQLADAKGLITRLTIIAGRYFDAQPPGPPPNSWASEQKNHVSVMRIEIPGEGRWTLPPGPSGVHRAVYVIAGSVSVNALPSVSRVRLQLDPECASEFLAANGPATLLLLEGAPIGEPVVQHGPFVMNTRQEIVEAYSDYKTTQFGGWPWESNEPIHGAQRVRFTVGPDGRRNEPT